MSLGNGRPPGSSPEPEEIAWVFENEKWKYYGLWIFLIYSLES